MTGPTKINQVSANNCQFWSSLLYHNLQTIYISTIKSLSLLQNVMGFLPNLQKRDTTYVHSELKILAKIYHIRGIIGKSNIW